MEDEQMMIEDQNMAQPSPQMGMGEMTPDEAAASLAFATTLSEGMMPKMVPEETEETSEEPKEPEEDLDEKLEALRSELKDEIKNEIGSLRDDIKQALDEED